MDIERGEHDLLLAAGTTAAAGVTITTGYGPGHAWATYRSMSASWRSAGVSLVGAGHA